MKAFLSIFFLVLGSFPAVLLAQQETGWKKAGVLPIGHVYQFYITSSGDLYAGSFENLFRSTNNAEDWQQIKVPPLILTCFYQYEKGLLIGTEEHGVLMLESTKDEPTFITKESVYHKSDGFLKVSSIVTKGKAFYAAFVAAGDNPRSLIYYKSADDNSQEWTLNSEIPGQQVRSLTLSGDNIIANTDKATFVAEVKNSNTPFTWNRVSYSGRDVIIRAMVSVGRGELYGLIDKQAYINGSEDYKNFYNSNGMIKKLWKATEDGAQWETMFADKDQKLNDLNEIHYANDVLYLTSREANGYTIYSNKINTLESGAWATEYVGDRYGASIHISSSGDKYVRPLRGVLKFKNGQYEAVNKGLTIINTHGIYANDKYIFALIGHGLYKYPINRTSDTENWTMADDMLPPGAEGNIVTWGYLTSSSPEEVIAGSQYGIQRSTNGGDTWTDLKAGFNGNTWLAALQATADHLYAIYNKKPYILENKTGDWKEITGGFDAQNALHLQKVGDEVYMIGTQYPSGATTLVKIYKWDKPAGVWRNQGVLNHPAAITNVRSFKASGNSLFFSFTTKQRNLFYRFGTADQQFKELQSPLAANEGYINHILSINNSLFLAPHKSKNIYVTYDDGNSWERFEDANFSFSDLTGHQDKMYAAFRGNGIYMRKMAEFFPPVVELEALSSENVRSASAHVSGKVTARENFRVEAVFEYSKNNDFTDRLNVQSAAADPSEVIDFSSVSATLKGLAPDEDYFYRLVGTNSGGVAVVSAVGEFTTKNYVEISGDVPWVESVSAMNGSVTETSVSDVILKLNQHVPNTVVKLHSRGLAGTEINERVLQSETDTYIFKLPHDQFDQVGLEYFFSVLPPEGFRDPDLLNEPLHTDTFKVAINHQNGLSFPEKLNLKDREYLMLSVPLALEQNSVQNIFGDELAVDEANNEKWRMLRYRPLAERSAENSFEWTELVNTSVVEPGKAYWLIAAPDAAVSNSDNADEINLAVGAGKTTAHALQRDRVGRYYYVENIPAQDWVQIGNPYLMDIDWNEVKAFNANSTDISDLITFKKVKDGSSFERLNDGVLKPFSGGYVKNKSGAAIALKIPVPSANAGGRIGQVDQFAQEALLSVRFSMASADKVCRIAGLGVHPEALAGEDPFDAALPPSLEGFPALLHLEESGSQQLTRSILPPQGDGQSWTFSISASEAVDLQWLVHNQLGHELWLRDLTNEHILNMQLLSQYKFSGNRQFKVYWGSREYIETNLMPDRNVLRLYPNPLQQQATISFSLSASSKDYQVSLSVLDLSGRQIQLISQASYAAGFHETSWNGQVRNWPLPKGIYLLELKTSGQSGTSVRYLKFVKD